MTDQPPGENAKLVIDFSAAARQPSGELAENQRRAFRQRLDELLDDMGSDGFDPEGSFA